MARTLFKISLNGLKEAQGFTLQQIRLLQNFRPVLERIARDFYRLEKEWFDSEGGGRWAPLSPRYAAWKARFWPGRPILQRSRRMYNEFTGATGHYTADRGELSIRIVGAKYWVEHDEGRGRLPARSVISPWVLQRGDTWNDMITNHIASTFGQRGRR